MYTTTMYNIYYGVNHVFSPISILVPYLTEDECGDSKGDICAVI
jgi:hypothetical protein